MLCNPLYEYQLNILWTFDYKQKLWQLSPINTKLGQHVTIATRTW